MIRQKYFEKAKEIIIKNPKLSSEKVAEMIIEHGDSQATLARSIRRWKQQDLISPSPAKVLIFDIETSPIQAYVWGVYNQNINPAQIIKDWYVVCWSAKWLFDDKIYNSCVTPQEAIEGNDKRVMENLWAMIDEADIVIAHNLVKFDEKKIKARFLYHDMNPPSFYEKIDTLKVAREFGITYKRLDFLAKFLDLPSEGKLYTDFNLWVRCDNGEQEALDYMQKYCDHDIQILEDTYLSLRRWIKNHPNIGLHIRSLIPVCPNCGSTDLTPSNKDYRTRTQIYDAYSCGNCGAHSRVTRNSTPQDIKNRMVR